MSSDIFKYVVNATESDLQDMHLTIDPDVQSRWQSENSVTKFDDLGDSLLHALNDILCGSSNYRQLIPSTPAVHTSRIVVLEIMPTTVYYAVLHCTWNVVTIEYFGTYDITLSSTRYEEQSTVHVIRSSFTGQLLAALTLHSASGPLLEVPEIQVVIKMLKGYDRLLTFSHLNVLHLSSFLCTLYVVILHLLICSHVIMLPINLFVSATESFMRISLS